MAVEFFSHIAVDFTMSVNTIESGGCGASGDALGARRFWPGFLS